MFNYMSYLLRVVLPDHPGVLGSVATALGKLEIDIPGIAVVEGGTEGAVDDLLVVLPPHGLADTLLTAVHSVPGAMVESLRPYPAGFSGLRDDFELVDFFVDRAADCYGPSDSLLLHRLLFSDHH